MGGLIPDFGNIAMTVAAFVVALSIIVAVHEYGHYIVGRWSGIHAEVFSLGFGPKIWSRVDKRGTRWQIAAIPLGGYVKFAGDANAASGKDGEAIATLTPDEVNAIVNRYVAVRVETPVDYRLLLQVVAVFVLILASNLFWVVRLRRANRKLARQAVTDALTGLANRKQLNRFSQGTVETARRHHRPLAVVLFDIDHFKVVNDQHGHLVGDQVLCDIAALLARAVRQGDCLGRWGGEEFLLICPETRGEQALQLAERILAQARNLPLATGKPCTLSAGVAQLGAGDSVNDLLQRADEALYQAKTQGRDRACLAQRSEQPELALDQRSEVVTHEG